MELQAGNRIQPPIEEMYRIAKRYSRRPDEVDDLVQDMLLEAIRIGKDFADARFPAWGHGFLRNHAAFIARTEARRRKREAMLYEDHHDPIAPEMRLPESFFTPLRPSLRIVARLVNCGLNRKEIRYLLGIADTALRQRLVVLRREWNSYVERLGTRADHRDDPVHALSSGLIRQSLIQASKYDTDSAAGTSSQVIGSHDPDGHLFKIRSFSAHKRHGLGNNTQNKGE